MTTPSHAANELRLCFPLLLAALPSFMAGGRREGAAVRAANKRRRHTHSVITLAKWLLADEPALRGLIKVIHRHYSFKFPIPTNPDVTR